jgi:hypothetical protein
MKKGHMQVLMVRRFVSFVVGVVYNFFWKSLSTYFNYP